jgi:hypothetical protein
MFAEKLSVRRKQGGVQALENAGQVNFRIFRVGMITVDEDSGGGR